MRNLRSLIITGTFLAVFLAGAVYGQETIYNNSTTDLEHRFNTLTYEVGDEIVFGGSARRLTHFDFEYYALNTLTPGAIAGANIELRVKLYANDGPAYVDPNNGPTTYLTPGAVLFDSQWFGKPGGFTPTDRETIYFTEGVDWASGGIFLPESITWSVQFRNLGAGDEFGLDVYGPPSTGSSEMDYWVNTGSGWELMRETMPMNFASRFVAIVPEPGSVALLAIGFAGMLLRRRRE